MLFWEFNILNLKKPCNNCSSYSNFSFTTHIYEVSLTNDWRKYLIMNMLMNNGSPLCRQLPPGQKLVWGVVWVWGPRNHLHHLQLIAVKHPAQGPVCEEDQTLQLPIHLSKSEWRWEMIKNAAVIRIFWHWKQVCSVFYGQHLQQY